jgi:tetrahydromethanopterin S-methyltransferase subunit B
MMTVSDWAPSPLTCRICLGRIDNPYAPPSGTTPPTALPPRRVIPLEQQVAADTRAGSVLLFVLAAILGGAAVISFAMPALSRLSLGLAAVAALSLTTAILQLSFPQSEGVRVTASVLGHVAKAVLAGILILVAVLALLIGACFVLVMKG